ncbi:hypothetical protein EH206_11475 [Brenneria nigrifluens DSM 30175 = ATCC 13028]|uniref:Uncharacterized protein n=1 Tax=Brenneria nigrifluens DSM 30175 = ATCC 13028 TaxID=1121120 RepID=A0ABX5UZ49_9GAMM|nr:hypothetical protein EH206_11475 [Brenneria nigrifluens DSM 30175 = ATCC 13028]
MSFATCSDWRVVLRYTHGLAGDEVTRMADMSFTLIVISVVVHDILNGRAQLKYASYITGRQLLLFQF